MWCVERKPCIMQDCFLKMQVTLKWFGPPMAAMVEFVLFADDAAFIITCRTLAGLYQRIMELFSDLISYLDMNKLVPNSRKSKLMMFKSRLIHELPSLSFGGKEIEWVTAFKYLGITITNNLNFSKHIDNISLNVSRMTGSFTCLRMVVPRNVLMKLYYALVYPHLNNFVVFGALHHHPT